MMVILQLTGLRSSYLAVLTFIFRIYGVIYHICVYRIRKRKKKIFFSAVQVFGRLD